MINGLDNVVKYLGYNEIQSYVNLPSYSYLGGQIDYEFTTPIFLEIKSSPLNGLRYHKN